MLSCSVLPFRTGQLKRVIKDEYPKRKCSNVSVHRSVIVSVKRQDLASSDYFFFSKLGEVEAKTKAYLAELERSSYTGGIEKFEGRSIPRDYIKK